MAEKVLNKQASALSLHGDHSLVLGIDLGTTSVKVCLIDANNHKCIKQLSKECQANVPSDQGSDGHKQYVPKILSALHVCVSRLPREALRRVERVGVCGQMHGCVLWKSGRAWSRKPDTNAFDIGEVSHLYTWQDSRCTPEFLASLPAPDSHLAVHSGYGLATLLWFLRHKPQRLQTFDRTGTIQDLLVAMLCDLDMPVMSDQNAASWGYFNTVETRWNISQLEAAGLPAQFLPTVVPAGSVAGRLSHPWLGIPAGTPVSAALGDLQCSVLPLLEGRLDRAILNVSTSAQMALLMPEDFRPVAAEAAGNISYLPYLRGRYLAVAASLTGGNALAGFVQMLQQWLHHLGFSMPQSAVWGRILQLAESEAAAGPASGSLLTVVPTVRGERHAPEQRASVAGIDTANTGLGGVTNAVCRGIADNLGSMMSPSWLAQRGVEQIVGTGSALARNAALRRAFESTYGTPLKMAEERSAAYGAAVVAATHQ